MHSIYESELAQWDGERARALGDAVSKVLLGLAPGKAADVLAALDAVQGEEVASCKLALLLATGDLQGARGLVDAQRTQDPTNDHWLLQDLYLELREGGASPMDLAATHRPVLEAMAAEPKSAGHVDAQAWLMLLDKTEPDATTVLPTTAKRRSTNGSVANSAGPQLLRAYPNPTTGPVYLVYEVPEGVEQAELRMMDASGRLVLQERVQPKNGIVEVLPSQLASGLHVAALYFDGIRVGTTKVHAER